MKIIRRNKTPMGVLYAVEGESGILECLSMPDYGDEKKHVCAISVSSGCSYNCIMCDAGQPIRMGKPPEIKMATYQDLVDQINLVLPRNWEDKKKIKLHLTRMGEPTDNWNIFEALREYGTPVIPNINTMMPNKNMSEVERWLVEWKFLGKYVYDENINTQISIHAVTEQDREKIFGGKSMNLTQIKNIFDKIWFGKRLPVLNFALCEGWFITPLLVKSYFSPKRYVIKFTDLHETTATRRNYLRPSKRRYRVLKDEFEKQGYTVLTQWTDPVEDATQIPCGRIIEGIKR